MHIEALDSKWPLLWQQKARQNIAARDARHDNKAVATNTEDDIPWDHYPL
jgi:hypothetical protein